MTVGVMISFFTRFGEWEDLENVGGKLFCLQQNEIMFGFIYISREIIRFMVRF